MNYENINIDEIYINKPINRNGIYKGKAFYNSEEVVISSPILRILSNIQISRDRCYIEVELRERDYKFQRFLNDIGEHTLMYCFKNSSEFFDGQDIPFDILDDYHKEFVSYSKGKYKIKIILPYDKTTHSIGTTFIDQNGNNIAPSDFVEGRYMKANLVFRGVKFYKRLWTEEWEGRQLELQLEVDESDLNRKYIDDCSLFRDEDDTGVIEIQFPPEAEAEAEAEAKPETEAEAESETKVELKIRKKRQRKNKNLLDIASKMDTLPLIS